MAYDETSRRTSERLDDDELIAILRREEQASANYWDSALGERYDEALSYYDRAPCGDEQVCGEDKALRVGLCQLS